MIERISKRLALLLVNGERKEKREIIEYGLQIIISTFTGICVIILVGICMQSILEAVVFCSTFWCVRRSTGGFHANSYMKCNSCVDYSWDRGEEKE